jgi:hypothetical protein
VTFVGQLNAQENGDLALRHFRSRARMAAACMDLGKTVSDVATM